MSRVPRPTFSEGRENFSEPPAPVDHAKWPTKDQVAGRLGVSTKTVEKHAREGRLPSAVWRRPGGGRPRVVYNPAAVDELASGTVPRPSPFVLVTDPSPTPDAGTSSPMVSRPAADDLRPALVSILSALAAALRTLPADTTAGSEKGSANSSEKWAETPWVDIPTAAAILGRSQAYVRRQITAGTLHAERDRWLVVRRRDLEAL